jgi:hypothetical protein
MAFFILNQTFVANSGKQQQHRRNVTKVTFTYQPLTYNILEHRSTSWSVSQSTAESFKVACYLVVLSILTCVKEQLLYLLKIILSLEV